MTKVVEVVMKALRGCAEGRLCLLEVPEGMRGVLCMLEVSEVLEGAGGDALYATL